MFYKSSAFVTPFFCVQTSMKSQKREHTKPCFPPQKREHTKPLFYKVESSLAAIKSMFFKNSNTAFEQLTKSSRITDKRRKQKTLFGILFFSL